ncbi:MAG: asparaginase domain-containing protein [Pseudomonadota bacterium]
MELELLDLGGTINGLLAPDDPPPERSRVATYLSAHADRLGIRCYAGWCDMKDSRAVTDEDRERLRDEIRRSTRRHILVAHGTVTLVETARKLSASGVAERAGVSVVVVGSMIPLEEPDSDAPANLDFAIEQLHSAPAGVWVAMNGVLWPPQAVEKDTTTGEFRRVQ